MTTKKKPIRIEDVVSSAAQRLKAEHAEVKAKVAALSARHTEEKVKAQDISDGMGPVAEQQAKWRQGDVVDGCAYADAKLAEARNADLIAFLPRRIVSLTRNLTSATALLSDHLAPALALVLPGVKVITTTAPYREWRDDVPADPDVPVVVIVEPLAREVETNPYTGEQSGRVEIRYFRHGLLKSIEVRRLEESARALGIAATVTTNRPGDESNWVTVAGRDDSRTPDQSALIVDTLTVLVEGALDGLPVVRNVTGSSPIKSWCVSIFGENSHTEGYTASHINIQNPERGGWQVSYGASVARGVAPKVSEVVSEGERTLTMRAVVNLSGINVNAYVSALRERAARDVGGVDGNGMLTEANVTLRDSGPGSVVAVDVTLTYKSQVPSGAWVEERQQEQRQRDAEATLREGRRADAEDALQAQIVEERRLAKIGRLHPGERAALSA